MDSNLTRAQLKKAWKGLSLRCSKHPNYKALRRPKVGKCLSCAYIWESTGLWRAR